MKREVVQSDGASNVARCPPGPDAWTRSARAALQQAGRVVVLLVRRIAGERRAAAARARHGGFPDGGFRQRTDGTSAQPEALPGAACAECIGMAKGVLWMVERDVEIDSYNLNYIFLNHRG